MKEKSRRVAMRVIKDRETNILEGDNSMIYIKKDIKFYIYIYIYFLNIN